MTDLTGKIALVTGGARNVGKAIARELAGQGALVIVNFFHALDAAKETRAEFERLGLKVELMRASVAQPAQLERMFADIEARFGGLDILVNNAASGALLPIDRLTDEHFDRAWNTNFKGSFWCSRLAAPLMARRGGGSIVNVSALGSSQLVMANYLACGPAKAAVEALTRYLAVEYAALNVRVNTASAAMLVSEVADSFPRAAEMQQVVAASTPLGRLGTADDFARVVAFLASDNAKWITGQVVLADGGLSLGSTLLSPPALSAASVDAEQGPALALEEGPDGEDIAVVGMGLAVPGANDTESFWRVLSEGADLVVNVPPDRWDHATISSPDWSAEDKTYQSASFFIQDFVTSEAAAADAPPDGYELTTLWLRHSLVQALEGVRRRDDDRFAFVVGYTADGSQHLEEASVLAGLIDKAGHALAECGAGDAEQRQLLDEITRTLRGRYWRGAAHTPSRFLPHRVGRAAMAGLLPATTDVQMVDTACSSSLYAVDIGLKGLLMGTHDVAVCGGAFALARRGSVAFAKLHGLSAQGQVRALDRDSDGVLFADGAGVVVLKRLRRAVADGDRVLAVIKGFGASSDGKGKAIYAPSTAGQAIAVRRAQACPGVEPQQLDWVVAHATGTPAGDLAEFSTLRETLAYDHPVYVTSNKSVIGHTGWAAGVVSLIQVVLGLQRQTIPPQHRFTAPPSSFEIDSTQLRIPTRPVAWPPKAGQPRTAAISGFGFGGTNAHLVVAEPSPASHTAPPARRVSDERIALVAWSAHLPGLNQREQVVAWMEGRGPAPATSFGEFYPAPPFEQVRMPPGAIRTLDRCQLMILQAAHDLRAQLGDFWDAHRETTGVFVGHLGPTRSATLYIERSYLDDMRSALRGNERLQASPWLEAVLERVSAEVKRLIPPTNEDSFPGSMPNVIPARVANYFDLKGPNMTLDTGLSSTLSAIDVACRYLRSGDVSMAIVGGINGNTTSELHGIVADVVESSEAALAEGAFLFALVSETTARVAGLPILASIEGPSQQTDANNSTAIVTCGAGGVEPGRTYLGAEAGLAVVRALHTGRSDATIVCRRGLDEPNAALRLSMPGVGQPPAADATPLPAQFANADEYAPAHPLEVRRHIARLVPAARESVRPSTPYLPSGSVVLTNAPELLDELESLPDSVLVLSTRPLRTAATGRVYLPEITADAVRASIESHLHLHSDRPLHLRVLSNIGASADPGRCLWEEPRSLVALHDLTFLALQSSHAALAAGRGASFVTLLTNAMPSGSIHPFAGLFTGLAKSAALELPETLVYAVVSATTELSTAVAQTEGESTLRRLLPMVVYDAEGKRYAPTLEERTAPLSADAQVPLGPESVVVATGGARGITAELLKALAEHCRPTLYLIGSNPLDSYPAEVLDGSDEDFARTRPAYLSAQRVAHPERSLAVLNRQFERILDARVARRNIAHMAAYCGSDRVHYIACDVLDREALQQALGRVGAAEGRIDLVISAAGLNKSGTISSKSFDEFRRIRDVKLKAYQNLKYALRGQPSRMWCNFGSLIGFVGQIGEADYASANDFLATAGTFVNEALHQDEFTIAWSLWRTVGLGAEPLRKAYFEKSGMYTRMATQEGIHHFVRELALPAHDGSIVHVGEAERRTIEEFVPGFFARSVREGDRRSDTGRFYLGRLIARDADEVVYERTFDLQRDDYLREHLVNGSPTLPGTFVTEIAAEVAADLVPDQPLVAFEDIVFHHFLRVTERGAATKRIHARVLERGALTTVQVKILADIVAPNGTLLVADRLHFEAKVVLGSTSQPRLQWDHWDRLGEVHVPDPYAMSTSPVTLSKRLISTTDTRSHPLGKRARYRSSVGIDDPVFSTFVVPAILLDGLARTGVLDLVDGDYIPVAAPTSIRRIDVYQQANDAELGRSPDPIELYVTPRDGFFEPNGTNRFVAARADGRVILQMKDVRGVVLGYVHRATGEFVSPESVQERRGPPVAKHA